MVGSYHVILLKGAESHSHEITEIAAEQFHIYQGADQLILVHKSTFEPGGVKTEEVSPGTSKQDSWIEITHGQSTFRRAPREGKYTHTPASVHLSNSTAKRRGIAKLLVGHFREITERNNVDTNGGDLNTSAFRKSGEAKLSSIETAWEKTLLIPPPDLVPILARRTTSLRFHPPL